MLFERKPHLAVYGPRLLLVALCQGGALQGKKRTNGVKDLDVYTFYSEDPEVPWPYRATSWRISASLSSAAIRPGVLDLSVETST